jgi:hypothetical protein
VNYEAWRPALIAFYTADGWNISAEHLRLGAPMSVQDKRVIEALMAAQQLVPLAA